MPDLQTDTPSSEPAKQDGSAAELIRQKIDRLYVDEPAASGELAESEALPSRSKHQQFMIDLSRSGKDLASIQTEWHNYYVNLPDNEKHQVWQEFYASQSLVTHKVSAPGSIQPTAGPDPQRLAEHKHETLRTSAAIHKSRLHDKREPRDIQSSIRNTVSGGGKLSAKHHFQSLLFGLGMGAIVVFIFLFGFFNEVVIAPLIQPSRVAAATPVIVTSSTITATSTNEVIIPKINVEIPVNYSETSTDESVIENDLNSGVVHYPTTSFPGQDGNTAFFGHSSNNIFNSGRYKFAFVLLHTLVPGDTFYLTYNGKVYIYKVISRSIVDPSDVSVLNPVPGQTATATLITCDPPGTSLHRLIIVGQQISPDPSTNTQSNATTVSSGSTTLPGNGPTLFSRFIRTSAGKVSLVLVVAAIIAIIYAWVTAPTRKHRRK